MLKSKTCLIDASVWFALDTDGHLMGKRTSGASWTDAYLAAFALGHGFALATFDRGFSRWKDLPLKLLPTLQ